MWAKDLRTIMMADYRTRHVFQGVFACDTLPTLAPRGRATAWIINTDPSFKKGEHWLALYIDPFGRGTYFDSYGFGPVIDSIRRFISKNTTTLKYNTTLLQSITSELCGYYCVMFIRAMVCGLSLEHIVSRFDLFHPTKNDSLVIHFFRHHRDMWA